MKYHILNGDAIAEKFPYTLEGQRIIIREAFLEGPLSTVYSNEFWERRMDFVSMAYDADKAEYEHQFMTQLELLDSIENDDEVFLWFEDDLFCLVNMWFVVHYLSGKTRATLYRIFPERDEINWIGFAKTKDLAQHFNDRCILNEEEIQLSNMLWEAFVNNDRERLKALATSDTTCFRFLPKVIQAHLDRHPDSDKLGRPQHTLLSILDGGTKDFHEMFTAFWKKESIYGFGDLQVINMLKEMGVDIAEDE